MINAARWRGFRRSHVIWGPLYTLPAVAVVLAFIGYPAASLAYHAFTAWDGLTPSQFIGMRNFTRILHDSFFWGALRNNLVFALQVPLQLTIPLGLAYLIHERIPGWRIFRSTFFLPAILSTVTVGILATQVFQLDGPFNSLLTSLGLGGLTRNWLASPVTSLPVILFVVVWANFGYTVLIYLGGMSAIDPQIAEAARIDGAGAWRILWYVMIPNLRNVMELVLVINTINAFSFMFTYVYVITGGGPGFETYTAELLIYQTAFGFQELGYASALGLVLIAIISLFGYLQIRFMTGGARRTGGMA